MQATKQLADVGLLPAFVKPDWLEMCMKCRYYSVEATKCVLSGYTIVIVHRCAGMQELHTVGGQPVVYDR